MKFVPLVVIVADMVIPSEFRMVQYRDYVSSEPLVFEFRNSKSESIEINNTDDDFKVFTTDPKIWYVKQQWSPEWTFHHSLELKLFYSLTEIENSYNNLL